MGTGIETGASIFVGEKNTYPPWKKIAWRFTRVFVAALLVGGTATLSEVGPDDLSSMGSVWSTLVIPFWSAGLIAAFSALAKALREILGNTEKDNFIHKIIL